VREEDFSPWRGGRQGADEEVLRRNVSRSRGARFAASRLQGVTDVRVAARRPAVAGQRAAPVDLLDAISHLVEVDSEQRQRFAVAVRILGRLGELPTKQLGVDVELVQGVVAHESEQEMLPAHGVVPELPCFALRRREHGVSGRSEAGAR
jgi:hypothetical protein